jgi:thiol-disulfide isomerase/thioredoxin
MHHATAGVLFVIGCLSTIACAAELEGDGDLGKIAVRVTDGAGSPQADFSVSLFSFDRDWRTLKNLERDTRTDKSGAAQYDRLAIDETYVVRAKSRDLVGFRQCILAGKGAHQSVDLVVARPVTATIRVRDEAGQAVGGATIWELTHNGANGSVWLDARSLATCGLSASSSDSTGELTLPALPGGNASITLIHPEYAPAELKDVAVDGHARTVAVLARGVNVALQVQRGASEQNVDSLMIDLRHEPFDHPSSLIGRLPELRPDGTAHVTVAPGPYKWLRLTHPDYVVTPIYAELRGRQLGDPSEPFLLQPGSDRFTFQLQRKVKVRGRVLDEATGKPIAGESVQGELAVTRKEGPLARFASEWSHADWGETNEKGEYEMYLAAGAARISFHGQGYFTRSEHYPLEVQPDGSTVAPDLLVAPLPKVRGVVLDEQGKPVPKAVVRFRGSMLTYGFQPVATDDQGRFELTPPWIPVDLQTKERMALQTVVAFDPYRPLCAEALVRLDEPPSVANLVLRMRPQDYATLITGYPTELNAWQRGIVTEEEKARLATISLVGKPPPALDGAQWLNTTQPNMSLSDFHGRYVLLQFWTTWCGPCHADQPSIKLAHKLYHDKGLVVIGVHDNSMPLDAIKEDAAKHGMSYPIVVDQPDGRILASYKEHGVTGYPSYVLLDPDGKVLRDSTVPGPHLRNFKLEIIRQLLMAAPMP